VSETRLFDALDELVDDCSGQFGDWDEVLRRAAIAPAAKSMPAAVASRPRRWFTRRRAYLAIALAVLLAVFFSTPAFGLLRDLIGRTNVSFSGKTAPFLVKRQFFDLSLSAPPGMAPEAIASQARRVAVFRAFGHAHVLYVAPTRKGGFCEMFTEGFGGCRQTRTPPKGFAGGPPGAIHPFLLGLSWQGSPIRVRRHGNRLTIVSGPEYTQLVGGNVLASNAASVTVEYEDHSSSAIPFVYVSKPIDAGFFYYQIPAGHQKPGTRVAAVTVRDAHGHVIAREPIGYAVYSRPPHLPPPLNSAPAHPTLILPAPTPPLQRGSADGVSVIAGHNGVVRFDISSAPARVQALIQNASYACFRYMRYHEDVPAELGFAPQAMSGTAIRIFGLPTPYDGCEIQGSYGHTWPDRNHNHSAVEIPFDARAARFFADRAAARDLALFLRSREMQKLRRLESSALSSALTRRYGSAIAHRRSPTSRLPVGKIGYVTSGSTSTFFEYSSTGRRFFVRVQAGRILEQNVKPLAFVF
jgi:hypothetical protein